MNKIITILIIILFFSTASYGSEIFDKLTDYGYKDYVLLKRNGFNPDCMYYSHVTQLNHEEEIRYWMRLYQGTTYIFYVVTLKNPVQVYLKEGFGNKRLLLISGNKNLHRVQFTINKTGVYYFFTKNNRRESVIYKINFTYLINQAGSNIRDYGQEWADYEEARR